MFRLWLCSPHNQIGPLILLVHYLLCRHQWNAGSENEHRNDVVAVER